MITTTIIIINDYDVVDAECIDYGGETTSMTMLKMIMMMMMIDDDDVEDDDDDDRDDHDDYEDDCDASQQQFLFEYETSVSKQPTRPTKFKLAYAQNTSSLDKAEFGTKSCKKAKIYPKKSNDKLRNPCTYIIMCISMICIYLTKQVNKLQPVGLPTSTSGFVKLYAKVKMATETCQMVKKHYDKSNGNFWDIYGYVKIYVLHDLYVFDEAGKQVETGWFADENQRLRQNIYNG